MAIPADIKVGKKKIPTLSIVAILFTLFGLLLGLLTGQNLNRSEPSATPAPSTASASPYEPWNQEEQAEAIAVSVAALNAYLSDYTTPATWQDSMAVYGTENFKSWTALADPSWVTKGHITGVEKTNYPNATEATITIKTTTGTYPVKLTKDEIGTVLVDEIIRN